MKTLTLRGKTIGAGRPKTIVPIVATTHAGIIADATRMQNAPLDVIEWRADFFEDVLDANALLALLQDLRATLGGEIPLLVTYRRTVEGGEGEASLPEYTAFCRNVMESGCADLLDIERSVGDSFPALVADAHAHGLPVIASSHNFSFTPSANEMVATLCSMQEGGADIAKLAVMPQRKADVLALFAASATMADEHPETPIVTMSMGALGQASRVCGASFGSAMTFASLGDASAPGQIALAEMNAMLDALYEQG